MKYRGIPFHGEDGWSPTTGEQRVRSTALRVVVVSRLFRSPDHIVDVLLGIELGDVEVEGVREGLLRVGTQALGIENIRAQVLGHKGEAALRKGATFPEDIVEVGRHPPGQLVRLRKNTLRFPSPAELGNLNLDEPRIDPEHRQE